MNYKSVFNIIKNYRWQSLFFRYWKIIAFVIAIPFLLCLCLFSYSYRSLYNTEYSHTFTMSSLKTLNNFSLLTTTFDNYYNMISNSDDFLYFTENILQTDNINDLKIYSVLNADLTSLVHMNDPVSSVYIYSTITDYVITDTSYSKLSEFSDNAIVEKLKNRENDNYIINSIIDGRECISVIYDMKPYNYTRSEGYLIINLDCQRLNNYLSGNIESPEKYMIFSDNSSMISQYGYTDKQLSDIQKIYSDNSNIIHEKEYFVNKTFSDITCFIPQFDKNLVFAFYTPTYQVNNLVNNGLKTFIIIVIVTLLLTVILSFITSITLYKSIATSVSELTLGKFKSEKQSNEINFLSQNLLQALNHNSEIEKDLATKMKQLRENQALALQTQINPHFIFNTLNLVNVLIVKITQNDCPPAKIISLLSDILYYSLNTDNFVTTLRDELFYTEKYIEIEQLKYEGLFVFKSDVDEKLLDCKIVKFILQPIVENSIEHGFKKMHSQHACLKLSIFSKKNDLHIVVNDNGLKISKDKLDELQHKLKNADIMASSKHIGLQNVNKRIKLMFGEKYGLYVSSTDEGFSVEIIQPLQ